MMKIVIESRNGQKVLYKVPDYIGNAVESLVMQYPHDVLEFAKEDREKK